jgi:hypothetical protein
MKNTKKVFSKVAGWTGRSLYAGEQLFAAMQTTDRRPRQFLPPSFTLYPPYILCDNWAGQAVTIYSVTN